MNNPKDLVDAHTHHPHGKNRFIESLDIRKYRGSFPQHNFCIGVHPWWSNELNKDEAEKILLQAVNNPHFCALGEMGLDKLKPNWDIQVEIFIWQLEFAKKHNIQNIIIHCVKSFNEIFKILKNYHFKILWHDFNGNTDTINQLSSLNSYFSIGNNVLKSNSKIRNSINSIALDRLLLETDDNANLEIIKVYEKACELKKCSLEELILSTNNVFDKFLEKH